MAARPVAVIPARDEAARLPHALAALSREGADAIVVANGCRDATAAVARAHGAAVIETPASAGGVGAARRVGMAMALERGASWLLTTDADGVVAPGTVAVLRDALGCADAAFGRAEPDAAEFAALPRHVRRHGALEDRHAALVAELEGLRAPVPWDPLPRHDQTPGALMAFRPEAYRRAGGFEAVPCHEDRGIAEALWRTGARIARPWNAVIAVSCRARGRAPGGMADTIAARATSDLRAETAWLAARCAQLEREARALRGSPSSNRETGASDVLPLVQAAI